MLDKVLKIYRNILEEEEKIKKINEERKSDGFFYLFSTLSLYSVIIYIYIFIKSYFINNLPSIKLEIISSKFPLLTEKTLQAADMNYPEISENLVTLSSQNHAFFSYFFDEVMRTNSSLLSVTMPILYCSLIFIMFDFTTSHHKRFKALKFLYNISIGYVIFLLMSESNQLLNFDFILYVLVIGLLFKIEAIFTKIQIYIKNKKLMKEQSENEEKARNKLLELKVEYNKSLSIIINDRTLMEELIEDYKMNKNLEPVNKLCYNDILMKFENSIEKTEESETDYYKKLLNDKFKKEKILIKNK